MGKISGVSTTIIDNVDGFFTTSGGGGGSGTASLTPTFTHTPGPFGSGSVTINNSHLYTNPNYWMQVKESGVVIVADADVDHGGLSGGKDHINNVMTFADTSTATGTRTVEVKAQEFGDYVESATVTTTYTKTDANQRYYRFYGVNSSGTKTTSNTFIQNIAFFTGSGQTGTEYPTTNLTDYTSETGFVCSAGDEYDATRAAWKAFDSSQTSTGWWSLGVPVADNNWIQVEFESGTYPTPPTLKSAQFRFSSSNNATHLRMYGSDTGAFAGEETDYGFFKITENTYMNLG